MAFRSHVLVCAGTGCVSCGSFELGAAIEAEIARRDLAGEIQVVRTGCQGFCAEGPVLIVQPDGVFYCGLKKPDVPALVEEHLLKGRPVTKLMYTPPAAPAPVPTLSQIPFFAKQKLVVLRNRGLIDPERIEDYIARDGYAALAKALGEMTPEQIIQEIKLSGLRGRGGGGFPTGVKWATCRQAAIHRGVEPIVVCNADEGDPGAFMDRSVLESDPHRVLEGMAIAAYAVGARQGYIYVRAEYPLAVRRLKNAIRQAERLGLLGNSIFGTTLNFGIEIRLGAGAFVCGEETALIASIEGERGQPRPRPPFPAERGLWGFPTLINNVETFANVPAIMRNGADWYAAIGTEKSKGTKVFALAGRVNNTGLIEVPMGITLRQIIFDIGGGIPDGKKFKAVQTGGPSGGCIPEQFLDMPIDYETLAKVGSIMGSGGMIVMDETSSAVDVARFFMEFCKDESCGKCVPCRVGTAQMFDLLDKLVKKRATQRDLDLLEELCDMVKATSLCGLGQSAPNPVLTTLKYFKNEYDELLLEEEVQA